METAGKTIATHFIHVAGNGRAWVMTEIGSNNVLARGVETFSVVYMDVM